MGIQIRARSWEEHLQLVTGILPPAFKTEINSAVIPLRHILHIWISVFTLYYIWHNQYLDQEYNLTHSWPQLVNNLNAASQVENMVGILQHQDSLLEKNKKAIWLNYQILLHFKISNESVLHWITGEEGRKTNRKLHLFSDFGKAKYLLPSHCICGHQSREP